MKKCTPSVFALAAALLVATFPGVARGETNTADAEAVVEVTSFAVDLEEGGRGDNVAVLQAFLAADSSIYPEGLITGYFGPLTKAAVKRFQARHAIVQAGRVGPITRARLNTLLPTYRIAVEFDEDGDSTTEGRVCSHIPLGHLIAPGWLRLNDAPLVPTCQKLPAGIEKKLDDDDDDSGTTTLEIFDIKAKSVGEHSATIAWETNEDTTGTVYWSTSAGFDLDLAESKEDDELDDNHSVRLRGLTDETTYYFVIKATGDDEEESVTSDEHSFTTKHDDDETAPTFSDISVELGAREMTIEWETNESATSKVYLWDYIEPPFYADDAITEENLTLKTEHSITVTGLKTTTTYKVDIESADANGNVARREIATYKTLAEWEY